MEVMFQRHGDDLGPIAFSIIRDAARRLIYGTLSKAVNKAIELIHFSYVITESQEFDLSESDSIKLGDKPIPVLGTFQFVDWQHHIILIILYLDEEKTGNKDKQLSQRRNKCWDENYVSTEVLSKVHSTKILLIYAAIE